MKKLQERVLLACVCCFFSLLLISGCSRLVHKTPEPAVLDYTSQTAICASVSAESSANPVKQTVCRRLYTEKVVLIRSESVPHLPAAERDANGNILSELCYTACVFAAFAPEDGFS